MIVKGPAGGTGAHAGDNLISSARKPQTNPIYKKIGASDHLHPFMPDNISAVGGSDRSFNDRASPVNQLNRQRTKRLQDRKKDSSLRK